MLKQITSEFRRFRKQGARHYSEPVKSMAISAVAMGLREDSVAGAAGVSVTTIRNWMVKAPKAKQLKLISAPKAVCVRQAPSAADLVCIRLASGVEIDLPRHELSAEFLGVLNSIGGNR